MTTPRPPIEFGGEMNLIGERLGPTAATPPHVLEELAAICPTSTTFSDRVEHGRDWWPLAMHWALSGKTVTAPSGVCRVQHVDQVVQIVAVCARHAIPITVAGGRSGVSGASIPVAGGIVIDTVDLAGIVEVDAESGLVCVLPGTFGPALEDELRTHHRLTVGHFPQSFAISTVGGWVASRGAGQYSTRYGTIADMVAGLEVVLPDATVVTFAPQPASSTGADLSSLFIGSEGTLGVVTKVWLRCHPAPAYESRATYTFASFTDGVAAMRDTIRAGATPAVLRLYDETESKRSHGGDGANCVLLVLDEGHPRIVDSAMHVIAESAAVHGGVAHADDRVHHWLEHRNDTDALQALTRRGFIVDTMEVAAPWSAIATVEAAVKNAAATCAGLRVASCHQSHSYLDGGCLYFTFVLQLDDPTIAHIELAYVELWNTVQRAALAAGANLAHHHGIGLNRRRFLREALGSAHDLWMTIKRAIDPQHIMNPGKMGDPGDPSSVWP